MSVNGLVGPFRRACAASVSGIALSFLLSAQAQAQDAATIDDSVASSQEPARQIVVTGSRIARNGAEQPTPVTLLTAEELTAASTTVAEALVQMPQLVQSTSLTNSSTNLGPIANLDLRSLGASRTLVLLNGRRLTPATTGTAPDINSLPQNLIQRVDIVTGGASAAYGSDAVSGVVNLVLDTQFEGLKGNIQGGITDRWDNGNYLASIAAGTSFGGDDRGHIVASAEYYEQSGVYTSEGRRWNQHSFLPLPNPAVSANNPASPTNPTFVIAPDAGLARTVGGTILSGPLAGIQFGEGGVPKPFENGTLRSANYMQGGDRTETGFFNPLTPRFWRWNAFTRASYDVLDNLTLYGEVIVSRTQNRSRSYPASYDFPILSGNPFIPASIQQQMTDLNLPSITVSRINLDWEWDPDEPLYDGGNSRIDDRVELEDYVVGVDGQYQIGDRDFTWNAYYQRGHSTYERVVPNGPINANIWSAIDAVTVTAANQGTSNLPLGSIVCYTTLSDPTNGCVPLNIFGPGAASQGALDYIYDEIFFKQSTRQDAAAFSTQGELFDTWAGPVSVAIGAEWRKVTTTVVSDELSQMLPADYISQFTPGVRNLPAAYQTQNPGVFLFGNYQPLSGSYNVKEAFFETVIPLAEDASWARRLEVNGAIRYADYSTSGGVTTWKAGVVYEPFDGLRLRGTRSRDIRAANIIELFSSARMSPYVITDPELNNTAYQTQTYQTGNPNLDPEKADTTTVGIVIQPGWAPGLTLSADFYDIKIEGAITTVLAQQVIDQCAAGSAEFCSFIERDPVSNAIVSLLLPNVNLAELRRRGIDFEAGYSFDLGGGRLALRSFVNYVGKMETSTVGGAPPIDRAGETGPGNGGLPHWLGRLTANYSNGPWSFIAQERFIGGGKYNNTYNTDAYNAPGQPISYINDNSMPSIFYTDLTLKYNFGASGDMEAYFSVSNAFDKDPPIAPGLSVNMIQSNAALYDVLGRSYTAGVKFKF